MHCATKLILGSESAEPLLGLENSVEQQEKSTVIENILTNLYNGQAQIKSKMGGETEMKMESEKNNNEKVKVNTAVIEAGVSQLSVSENLKENMRSMELDMSMNYPIELKHDKVMGRCLAAARDIEPGEIFLNDWPIITAPNAGEEGATCLGCCLIKEELEQCSRCGWPVCGVICSDIPQHAEFECKVFAKEQIAPTLPPPYNVIEPAEYVKILRCLLLKDESSPMKMEKWNQILSLEAHMNLRKNIPRVQLMSKLVKRFVRTLCQLDQYDEASIDFVLGVVDVNAFRHSFAPEPLKPLNLNGQEVEGPLKNATFLYPRASMAAHGCVRNTDWRTLAGGQLEMRASLKIRQGQLISHAYVDLMIGTPERRRLLHNIFYFDCTCIRCSDPTELNTFFSALKCMRCSQGYLLPENPLEYKSSWTCTNKGMCDEMKSYQYERSLVQQIHLEEKQVCKEIPLKTNLQTIKSLTKILKAHRNVTLHPNHYRIVSLEYILLRHLLKITKPPKEIMLEIKRILKKYMELSAVFHPSLDD